MLRRHLPRALIALAASGAALLAAVRAPEVGATASGPARLVHVRVLGINDLHGHLDPTDVGSRAAGGVAWLASWLDSRSADGTPTIRVTAGDSPGASPLISAHFHDQPAVEALNLMHFDVGTVGNHDFDEGPAEMLRLVRGGDGFAGADFPYVGANALDADTGRPVLPPYVVVERAGVRIGFIGVTTRASARWLLPRYASQLRFADISDTVNRYARELQDQGVQSIVVLAHAGGVQESAEAATGEIVDETREMSDAVDVVVSGHTHTVIDLHVAHKLVTQAAAFGTAFDQIDMTIDPRTADVVSARADIVRTWDDAPGIRPDPLLAAMVEGYRDRLGELVTRTVAYAPEPIMRTPGEDSPNRLGTMVADSERAAAHADIAFVAPAWVRADLPAGRLTYADLFEVQPFGDELIRMTMSGGDLQAVLDEQHTPGQPLLIASGLPQEIDPRANYTVVVCDFLASGGEGFSGFTRGRERAAAGKDIDALVDYAERLLPPP
ncbi:MAG: bifunctional metallophosphatase/5'-nucleotidase [Thermoleophilaceae bacterium]